MHFSSKLAKKSKKWRGALIYLALFGVAPMALGAETRYVSDYASLRAAISEYNENTGADFNIVLTGDITLAGNLPEITGNARLDGVSNGALKIEGSGYEINGTGQYRGLYIDGSNANATVTISNIEFADCYAKGGDGGAGSAGGGGGMGAGSAVYAYSGNVVLNNVTASGSVAVGGNGGSVLYGSESYGGGGGLGGNGGSGQLLEPGAAAGGGIYTNGANSSKDKLAGDGGVVSSEDLNSYGHVLPGTTTPAGGDSLAGGGGGGSIAVGGNGGFGGGAGAGGAQGGKGGFGGGGAGSSSSITAGAAGFGAGNGGYVEPVKSEIFDSTPGGGTGGGGAALGGAIFVGSQANVTVVVDENSFGEIYGGSLVAGQGGGGSAQNGEAIGTGLFLLNDLNISVAEGGKYVISDSIGGYAGSKNVVADANGNYENTSGIVKSGEGELLLNAGDASYTGDTTVKGGTLVANTTGAISVHSNLNVDSGTVDLKADQSVRNLNGGSLGVVNLNSNKLTITGDDEDGAYAGKIKGNGTLVKEGTNAVALSGDSRGEEFDTILKGGTIRVQNDGAFGDGTVSYTRNDVNDQTTALEFANGVNMANDIVLSGNSNALVLGGGSATISGKISKSAGSNNEVVIRVADGESICLTNTGVTVGEDGKISISDGNDISKLTVENGGVVIDVDSFVTADMRWWYSSIGTADIVNNGDNNLSMILNTNDPDAGLRFSNNIIVNSGWLTVEPVTLKDSTDQVKTIGHVGSVSGNGGFRLDIGAGATYDVLGSYGVGSTDVKSGTLNFANVKSNAAYVGGLTSDGAGTVSLGTKDLVVNFNSDVLAYNGKIVGEGDGANIYKNGTGEWNLNLTNDSKVNSININDGALALGTNHFDSGMYTSNDFAINLGSGGTLKHITESGETLTLNNLNASNGGSIVIGAKDEIVLTGANSSTNISANLNGEGWLYLKNVTDAEGTVKPWAFNGNNSGWKGTIAAYDPYAQVSLQSVNAGSVDSSIAFGSHGVLSVQQTNSLGSLAFDDNLTIKVDSGKDLTLGKLSSSVHMLDDSVLAINGGGTVALQAGAASNYYGATTVTDGSTLLLRGDNTADGAVRRTLTLADGVLAMDYTGVQSKDSLNSYWGSEIDVNGNGTIVVAGNPQINSQVRVNENIGFVGDKPGKLDFNTANSVVELASTIDGSGTLDKLGNGTLILNGAGTFGAAIVDQGLLRLGTSNDNPNDQLRFADLTINNGGVDGWSNNFGSIALNSKGSLHLYNTDTVSLTGSGNVFSMNGGTLHIDVVDKDNYTNFKAEDSNATAQMNGGTIYVDTDKYGANLAIGDSLTIVDVDPGNLSVNPSKFAIYDDYAGWRFVIDRSKINDGYFNLLLKRASFAEFAKTDNQKSVANYLDSWQDGSKWNAVHNDMFAALENAVERNPGVLDQLTGELRFSAMNTQIQSRNLLRQNLTRNVLPSPTLTGCRGVNTGYSAIRGQSWNYGEEATGLAGWASMFGASGDASAHHGTSGYDYQFIGGMFGIELGSTATNQFGFYYSYNNSEVDSGRLGNVAINDNIFGLYLRASDDWGYTFATGSLGVADYDIDRSLAVGNKVNYFNGSTDGWSGSAMLERGVNFCLPASTFQPYGAIQYTHLNMDGFTEEGTYNAFALSTTDTEYNSLQGVIGARWLKSILLAGSAFDFNAYVNWTHEFLDESVEGDVTMIAGPNNSFHIIGNGAGRDWIYAGLGGDWLLSESFDIFGGADVQTNDYTTYVNGNGGFRIKW